LLSLFFKTERIENSHATRVPLGDRMHMNKMWDRGLLGNVWVRVDRWDERFYEKETTRSAGAEATVALKETPGADSWRLEGLEDVQ